MSNLTIHAASELPFYEGPHAIEGIRFRQARKALGVSAWGMNVLELAPACEGYPAHNHAHDDQEEVYVVLTGSVELHADGAVHPMKAGDMVRVPPAVTRSFVTTAEGALLLAMGGVPGAAYTVAEGM